MSEGEKNRWVRYAQPAASSILVMCASTGYSEKYDQSAEAAVLAEVKTLAAVLGYRLVRKSR